MLVNVSRVSRRTVCIYYMNSCMTYLFNFSVLPVAEFTKDSLVDVVPCQWLEADTYCLSNFVFICEIHRLYNAASSKLLWAEETSDVF
jgi:hypothetical protein